MTHNRKADNLESLRAAIESLGQYGADPVSRRALQIVDDHRAGRLTTDGSTPLSTELAELIEERIAGRSVARVSVDPVDHLAALLIDLHDGRLNSIEFDTFTPEVLSTATERAREFLDRHRPEVTVSLRRARTAAEVALLLREAAELVEAGAAFIETELDPDHHSSPFFRAKTCLSEEYTVGAPYWKKGEEGKTIVKKVCQNHLCGGTSKPYDPDKAVPIIITIGRTMTCREEVVWTYGGPSKPPSIVPPDFKPVEWTPGMASTLPFFSDPHGHWLTSRYGWRRHPTNGGLDFHEAIDVSASAGTPVLAVTAGRVLWISPTSVDPKHPEYIGAYVSTGGVVRQYWHVHPTVQPGDEIAVGQQLGTIYDWGATRSHLHFEVHRPPTIDVPFNPGSLSDQTSADPLLPF